MMLLKRVKIPIKTEKEINIMREGGRILAKIMEELKAKTVPGITSKELNRAAEALIFNYKAEPAFKGFVGKKGGPPFPAVLCVSVNSVLVHAAPNNDQLKEGDLVSLDLGIKYQGFYTDMAATLIAAKTCRALGSANIVNYEAVRLVKTAKKALKAGIKKARPGNTFGDVSNTIERFIEGAGFGVVRELCGHGIGRQLHEEPQIPNYGKRRAGEKIKQGMVFCLEPMVTIGDWHLRKSADGFGLETKDGSLCAHFEHTIAVTSKGAQVLTKL